MGSGQPPTLALVPHPIPRGSSRELSTRCLQGIKKPYNPILGETFRCCWFHPQTNSHTFYIAEQASPPHPQLDTGLHGGQSLSLACILGVPPGATGPAL